MKNIYEYMCRQLLACNLFDMFTYTVTTKGNPIKHMYVHIVICGYYFNK